MTKLVLALTLSQFRDPLFRDAIEDPNIEVIEVKELPPSVIELYERRADQPKDRPQ